MPLLLIGGAALTISLFAWQPDAQGAAQAAPNRPVKSHAKRDPLAVKIEERLKSDVRPLIRKYCYECHGNGKKKGGVALDKAGDIKSIMDSAEDWLTVVEVMGAGLMPPEKKPQPTAHEKLTIQQWVDQAAEYYPADAKPDPGWYTIHRLNRSEYRNTMRDLLGIDPAKHDLAESLPSDDTGYGFDNNADVLSMSTLQLEKFLQSAEKAVDLALDPMKNEGFYDEVFFIKPTADDKGNRLPGVEQGKRITESQAARQVIEKFATRAFRRRADTGEVTSLLRLYRGARAEGDDYESAVRLALTATLVSPNFLYRPIRNPKPHDPGFIYELDDYELASRLSYFLWSSMPDDRLLDLARAKQLRKPETLKKQVQRMLLDPRSDALVENFAGQWLLLRKLDGLEMDTRKFPAFDAELREAMRSEAEHFFADVLRSNRSVLSFLDSDRTFLNETLADHYGIRGIRGDDFRMVDLPADSTRGGVLTMAATLTVTSHATRTSPVKRGDYVLAQLMGSAPPPPPPDVPPLEQATEAVGKDKTLREQLAAHVADPNCAVCHKRLDPIGLAMENFDAIGAWRDREQGKPIDASGELPGGVAFNGPIELKAAMLQRQGEFVENLAKKMLTYAVGRGTEPFDRPTTKKIVQSVEDDGYRMRSLIEAIVLSDAFTKARGRETQP
ncbi:MAG: DUF1592 domain-containing protein [Phycisphaeraceae bacterium]|nr:DUF1592 domain-containing protein [Phycisphaeraceae bacterium]